MTHLVEVWPETITEQELKWLDKVAGWFHDGETFRTILEDVARKDLTLWRLAGGPSKGLVGTRLILRPNGLQLWLELFVGEGLLADAPAIREAVHALAHRAGCHSLAGMAHRPGLVKFYEKVLGVRPSATFFREEL